MHLFIRCQAWNSYFILHKGICRGKWIGMAAAFSSRTFSCKINRILLFVFIFMMMFMTSSALAMLMLMHLLLMIVMARWSMLMMAVGVVLVMIMVMFFFVVMFLMGVLMMWVRAIMMSSCIFISVEDIEDVEVANQSEDRSEQHKSRLFDYLLMDDSTCCFNEKFHSYYPNDSHVQKCSQRLHFFVSECQSLGTLLIAHEDGEKWDHIGKYIREEMEGIGEDCDRVSIVPSE